MKKINLKGISKVLSEKQMKNVMGGSSGCSEYKRSGSVTCCYPAYNWCVNGYCKSRP